MAADDHAQPHADDDAPMTFSSPEEEVRFRAAVQEGLDDLAAGRTVPYEKVREWLLSWGTPNELPPPECD